jgi:hypothetical protein
MAIGSIMHKYIYDKGLCNKTNTHIDKLASPVSIPQQDTPESIQVQQDPKSISHKICQHLRFSYQGIMMSKAYQPSKSQLCNQQP